MKEVFTYHLKPTHPPHIYFVYGNARKRTGGIGYRKRLGDQD